MASFPWPRVMLSPLAGCFFSPASIGQVPSLYHACAGLETASEWSRLSGEVSGKVFPQN